MSKVVDKFLNEYGSSSTRYAYSSALNWFFKSIAVEPDSYFIKKRDYEADIKQFKTFLCKPYKDKKTGKEKSRPPMTTHLYMMAVKQFLLENKVDLGSRFWRSLFERSKMKRVRPVTNDKVPTKQQIQQFLSHATVRDRAITLTLISSGMRIGELLQIKLEDIDLTKKPGQIDIQPEYTKGGVRRTVFFSEEAKASLTEWMKVRQMWLNISVTRLNGINKNKPNPTTKSLTDERLFPYNYLTVKMGWMRMLKQANLDAHDTRTDRCLIHFHSLRKFYSTNITQKMRKEISERLLGHEGYLSGSYERYTTEEMAAEYLKAENIVSVYDTHDISNLESSLEEKDRQIRDLTFQLQQMKANQQTMADQIYDQVMSALKQRNGGLENAVAFTDGSTEL